MKLLFASLLDLLLRIVPGSRFNPNSLESRVRHMTNTTQAVIDAAIAKEIATRAAVMKDAQKGANAAWEASHAASKRAKDLEKIANSNQVTEVTGL